MPFVSKVKMVYRPRPKHGILTNGDFLEAFGETFSSMRKQVTELDEQELGEMRQYFNSVTIEDDLGDFLCGVDYTKEDLQSKITSLDDESQE